MEVLSNVYHSEIFQEAEEQPSPVPADVEGSVPNWVSGTILRLGPGKFSWDKTSYNHWFEGDAIMNRFHVVNGQVEFSSKFVKSASYLNTKKKNRIARQHFATNVLPDPCKNIFKRYASHFFQRTKDSDCTNVTPVRIKDEIYATADMTVMWKIDADSLETAASVNVEDHLPGPRSWTAHPHFDKNGDVFNCSTAFEKKVYEVVRIPAQKERSEQALDGIETVATIPFQGNSTYYHSFGMTERFFIFIETSMVLKQYFNSKHLNDVIGKLFNKTHANLMKFKPGRKSRFHLVDKKSGKVAAVYSADAFFCFHQVNAYEVGDEEVVFDCTMYPDGSVIDNLYLSELRSGNTLDAFPAELRRYRLPLCDVGTGSPKKINLTRYTNGLDHEVLHPSFELPKINYAMFNARKYRYAYGVGNSTVRRGLSTLVKVDVDNKEHWEWQEENCYPSEPVFISSPDAEKEDDGILMSAVTGLFNQKSFLLILDASSMTELARAYVPTKLIPLFHAEYFPS